MKTKEQIKDAAQTTFRNHLEFLSSGQIEKWVDLFDENGILEFPYGPSDFPN
jgi:ketosteroid isomerase-like protein